MCMHAHIQALTSHVHVSVCEDVCVVPSPAVLAGMYCHCQSSRSRSAGQLTAHTRLTLLHWRLP